MIAGVYAGYFGAASGIILLAIISLRLARRIPAEPLRYMIGLSGLALAMSLAMV